MQIIIGQPRGGISARIISFVGAFVMVASPVTAATVFDDFSDLNDTVNPTWTHLTGLVASTLQTFDASTGQYRMTAANNGFSSLGVVGSYTGPAFTDVVVAADVVSFINDPQAQGAPFAVAARLDGNNAFNLLKGYAFAYDPVSSSGLDKIVLYRITGASLTNLGEQQVTLDPTRDYRFELSIIGTQLHGQVFDIGGGGGSLGEVFGTDATYASGFSGFFAFSQTPLPPVDVTWDNFSSVPEPGIALLAPLAAGTMILRGRKGSRSTFPASEPLRQRRVTRTDSTAG
jgi:hypothetical protein